MNSYSDQTIAMRMDMTYSYIFNKELLKKIALLRPFLRQKEN